LANLFRAKVVDVAKTSVIVELAGTEEKIEAFIELMKPYGIAELARTGVIAMARGMQIGRENHAADASKIRKRSMDAPSTAALPPS
jgi:acetolactate synthase-1/3 small subunit